MLNISDENSIKDNVDVILLHDCVCKDIDIKRLMNQDNKQGKKIFTATVGEATTYLQENLSHAGIILLHVGINDFKTKSIDEVSKQLEDVTRLCLDKADKVILALPVLCKEQNLASKVTGLMNMLFFK